MDTGTKSPVIITELLVSLTSITALPLELDMDATEVVVVKFLTSIKSPDCGASVNVRVTPDTL